MTIALIVFIVGLVGMAWYLGCDSHQKWKFKILRNHLRTSDYKRRIAWAITVLVWPCFVVAGALVLACKSIRGLFK